MLSVVIQAGGKSNRMGQNKALMLFCGETLISRLIRQFSPIADELLINANDLEAFAFLGLPVVADKIAGIGALGGLYTAIDAARHPAVVVIACDMPFSSAKLASEQARILMQEDVDVVIPRTEDGYEPFHAVYRREPCHSAIQSAITAGNRRMISWFDAVRVRTMLMEEVKSISGSEHTFVNINTPDDFSRAELLAKSE